MAEDDTLTVAEGAAALGTLPPGTTGIDARGLTDDDAPLLSARPELERLDLGGSPEIGDETLTIVAGLPSLEWLSLNQCTRITDDGIARLASSPSLRTLLPCGCQQLGDGSLEALARMPSIREVFITGGGFTDDGMFWLMSCPSLEILGIDGPIGDAGYAKLAGHPTLEELHLPSCLKLSLDGLEAFAAIPFLETLAFYATPQVDDTWLARLAGFGPLKSLTVMGCGVTDEGLATLRERRPDLEVFS